MGNKRPLCLNFDPSDPLWMYINLDFFLTRTHIFMSVWNTLSIENRRSHNKVEVAANLVILLPFLTHFSPIGTWPKASLAHLENFSFTNGPSYGMAFLTNSVFPGTNCTQTITKSMVSFIPPDHQTRKSLVNGCSMSLNAIRGQLQIVNS